MTCIIGLVEGEAVYIGGDSASAADWTLRATSLCKVFRVGPFVIGYTDSFRMGQILQHHLEVRAQEEGESVDEFIVRAFVEAVRQCLKDHGYSKIENNVETGGAFLVGYRGRLFQICGDFQANTFIDQLDAVGAGFPFALGAMKALEHLPPVERITRALEIAAHFSNAVKGPFYILEGGVNV